MTDIAAFNGKAMLDWTLGGASPSRPAARFLGVSKSAPSSTNALETSWPSSQGNARQTISFGAAGSPAVLATNAVAVTFGPASNLTTIRGFSVWDTGPGLGSGNLLWFGTLTTAPVCSAGDTVVFAVGALQITLV